MAVSSDKLITTFARQVRRGVVRAPNGPMRLGVDLGTANIVLSVIDADNNPVAGSWRHATVVRDGIVVDWTGAVHIVRELKADLQKRLNTTFKSGSVAIPPGISAGTIKVFTNVLNAADLNPDEVVDEPVAASRVLGVTDGCVIDVGHGTTGVSVMKDGKVVLSIDEPTGGHHMTLVLAGAYGISYDEAEKMKQRGDQKQVFGAVRPTIEKMASIAKRAIAGQDVSQIFLVGGASSLDQTPGVFADILGMPVIRPPEPLFVTPLGIAMVPASPKPAKTTKTAKTAKTAKTPTTAKTTKSTKQTKQAKQTSGTKEVSHG